MIRHSVHTVSEIFILMDNRRRGIRDNVPHLRTKSDRLRMFHREGVQCCHCPRRGTFFALESVSTETPHLNLYCLDADGTEMLMTKDHRVPKSRGGANDLTNYQPMCVQCNGKKADLLPAGD